MSALYGSIETDAAKTNVTRRGHKAMSAHIRGWEVGVRIEARHDKEKGDTFAIFLTHGSNGAGTDTAIGEVELGQFVIAEPKEANAHT
jgi:hypothetical protein